MNPQRLQELTDRVHAAERRRFYREALWRVAIALMASAWTALLMTWRQ